MRAAQCGFRILAGNFLGTQVNQEHVAVGAAGNDAHAARLQSSGHPARVRQNLLLVIAELGRHRLLQRNGLGGDHVHQRPALDAGENRRVDDFLVFGLRENDAAARSAQRLVRGGRHEIGDAHRAGIDARGDQSGVVGHVHEQVGADRVGDFAQALPVEGQRISRCAGDDHLRLVVLCEFRRLVVIHFLLVVQPVGDRVVQLARQVDRRAVRQVAAACQRQAEDGVTGFQRRGVHSLVGLRSGMRLHIRHVGLEQRLGPVDRELLGHVHEFAAAVITFAGIAFRVFVGEHRTLGLEHARAGMVLGCNELDVVFLAAAFGYHGLPQVGIEFLDGLAGGKHGFGELEWAVQ